MFYISGAKMSSTLKPLMNKSQIYILINYTKTNGSLLHPNVLLLLSLSVEKDTI
jgi:hypothetical protein